MQNAHPEDGNILTPIHFCFLPPASYLSFPAMFWPWLGHNTPCIMAIAFLFFSPSVALLSLLSPLVLGPAGERKKARHARKKSRLLASGDITSLLKTFLMTLQVLASSKLRWEQFRSPHAEKFREPCNIR